MKSISTCFPQVFCHSLGPTFLLSALVKSTLSALRYVTLRYWRNCANRNANWRGAVCVLECYLVLFLYFTVLGVHFVT